MEKGDPRDFDERWRERSRQMFDSSEGRKAFDNVFDNETKRALLKLGERRVLERLYGTIESGKESVVFLGDTPEGERVLVKIYMMQAGNFRRMKRYLTGDRRFRNVKDNRRAIVKEWSRKEFKNLKKASNILRCPEPIAHESNILVMEFIGKEFSPYPKLKDVEIENPDQAYENVVNSIKKLWEEEDLVHGDLSEYNILVEEDRLVWIDFSQGVHKTHPEARELLERDVKTVAKFFHGQGAEVEPEKAYQQVFPDSESL